MLLLMAHDQMSGPYLEAIRRGFLLAREARPALRAGASPGRGRRRGRAGRGGFRTGQGDPAWRCHGRTGEIADTEAGAPAGKIRVRGAGHRHKQAQGAAMALAESRGERVSAEHLLIALVDQGTAPVLRSARPGRARPPGRQAGHGDGYRRSRPAADRTARAHARGDPGPAPLPVAELDDRAGAALRWRQDHLPVGQAAPPVQPRGAAASGAGRSVAGGGSARPRRRSAYSLISRHADEVGRRVDRAWPDFATPPSPGDRAQARAVALSRRHRRRRGRTLQLRNVTVGWGGGSATAAGACATVGSACEPPAPTGVRPSRNLAAAPAAAG